MSQTEASRLLFYPVEGPPASAERSGFRFGNKGTHSSRTLMLAELQALLDAAPGMVDRAAYAAAIVEANCLGKPTASTRRASNQRLGELYSLDPSCPIFRVMRRLWAIDPASRPLLAMLVALARDPLFLASAPPILALSPDAELPRMPIRAALHGLTGDRMNDAVLDKVVRNVASSWAQTGHLEGRTFKVRRRVSARPVALAFALYLARGAGLRGDELFTSGWVAALDCTASSARGLAIEAKRAGLIDLHASADVLEIGLARLDPTPSGHRAAQPPSSFTAGRT